MRKFTATTNKLSEISFYNALYFEFVDNDGNVLQYTEVTECKGILSGAIHLPTNQLQYQLHGYDINGNPFFHIVSKLLMTFDYPDVQTSLLRCSMVVINPCMESLVCISIKNNNYRKYSSGINYMYIYHSNHNNDTLLSYLVHEKKV